MAYSQYGIGVTKNRFELFDNDEDPLEVLKKRELEKEARKKTKLSEKENSANTKSKELPKIKTVTQRKVSRDLQSLKALENQKTKEEGQIKGLPRHQSGKNGDISSIHGTFRDEKGDRQFSVNMREDRIDNKFEKPELRDGGNRSGGRGAIRGGGRGGRRPVFDLRGKREFERQSGSDKTGVKAVEKRDGGGAHNWGTHKDVLEEIQEGGGDERWGPDKTEEVVSEPQMATVESEEVVNITEDSARVMTLDEWKAQRMPRQKPTYNLRKAGEGEDLSHWKKMYALEKKKDGEDDEEEEDEEYEHCEYPQRVGRQKHVLDIDIRFKDARVAHGRQRGMGRGVGRNFPRPMPEKVQVRETTTDQKEIKAPKVDDEHDFPSLG